MQQNIGILDRYIRVTGGLLMYAGGFQMRRSFSRGALLTLGAMKIAEGISGWCPLLYAMGVQTLEDEVQSTAKSETTTESNSSNKDDSKPNDSKPNDSKPNDNKPNDSKPNDGKPDDSKPNRLASKSGNKLKQESDDGRQPSDSDDKRGQGPDEEILFS